MIQVSNLKILGIFFSGKNIILCILKGISPLKMHKIIYICPENLKKFKVSPVNLGRVGLP